MEGLISIRIQIKNQKEFLLLQNRGFKKLGTGKSIGVEWISEVYRAYRAFFLELLREFPSLWKFLVQHSVLRIAKNSSSAFQDGERFKKKQGEEVEGIIFLQKV